MRILVTGASGLLGINLALEVTKQHTVIGLVNHHQLNPVRILFRNYFNAIQADLLDPGALERVLDQTQPDWVIHCAAMAIVDACETDPGRAWKFNTEVPAKLAALLGSEPISLGNNIRREEQGARDEPMSARAERACYIFQPTQFSMATPEIIVRRMNNPLSIYARTKLESERVVFQANPEALIARVSTSLVGASVG